MSAARSALRDYWELAKPRVVALVVFTAVAGMAAAVAAGGAQPQIGTLLLATIGITLAAGGAAAANCLIERGSDALMSRTCARATAAGRVRPLAAALYSAVLCAAGLAVLQWGVNTLTMLLTLLSIIGYSFVYTAWLKRATPQNIVIGGAAGAMPPLLGWTAASGGISHEPLLLVLIIFVWTPPHFWALSLYRVEDYRKASIPMLPVTHGAEHTRLQILLYSLALFAASLLPYATGMAGLLYLVGAGAAGCRFVLLARALWRTGTDAAARKLFNYSGAYLLAVFALLMADTLIAKAVWS